MNFANGPRISALYVHYIRMEGTVEAMYDNVQVVAIYLSAFKN
jgi:hypothetical protein